MSERTRCNYCSLRLHRRLAAHKGYRIHVEFDPTKVFGWNLYEISKGIRWCSLTKNQRAKAWISGMMEIPNSCAC